MDKVNLQVIRESFGRVVYSHKTHEKAAEIEAGKGGAVKWFNVILVALTSGTLLTTIIVDKTVLIYTGAVFSAVTLGFIIFQLSFNPEEMAEKHRQVAKELWYVREKYVNLIADITNERISDESIAVRRDELIDKLNLIYKFAPIKSSKSYKKAREALKINEEMTFNDEEIDQFLPEELKLKKE